MYLPNNLMWHKYDHYKFTESITGGARVPYRVSKNIRCNIGPVGGGVVDQYKQREEQPTACLYTLNGDAFNQITVRDRIVSQGSTYRVIGADDLDNIGKVYRVDLIQEVS